MRMRLGFLYMRWIRVSYLAGILATTNGLDLLVGKSKASGGYGNMPLKNSGDEKAAIKTPLENGKAEDRTYLKSLLKVVDVSNPFSGLNILPSNLDGGISAEDAQYKVIEIALNKILLSDFERKRALDESQIDLNLPVNPHKFDSWGIRTKTPSIHTVKTMKLYAAAAYCKLERLVGWKCGENCRDLTKGTLLDGYLSNEKEKTAGIVVLNHAANLIIISYRGSSNMNNWLDNAQMIAEPFNLVQVKDADRYGPLNVHRGFQSMARSLFNRTLEELGPLLDKYPNYHVAVTGHSAGGAIAVLTAAALGTNGLVPFDRIILTTFGQPRVGSPAFTSYLNSQPIISARVTNGVDFVNVLPAQEMGFHHQHNELFLTRTNGTDAFQFCSHSSMAEDPSCARISRLEKKVRGHYEYFGNLNTGCT